MNSKLTGIVPVILSGGSGSRLWPLSRTSRPKQFLNLTGDQSLFQLTLARLAELIDCPAPIVVANDDHRFLAAEQCQETGIKPSALILEPCARNTAPAIAIAALQARSVGDDPILLVLPSDHVLQDISAFGRALAVGYQSAMNGALVTFGIVPTSPETGYGYVRVRENKGKKEVQSDEIKTLPVESFVEKPDLKKAVAYFESGEYLWNSGMFMFKASVVLAELARFNPQMLSACKNTLDRAKKDLDFIRLDLPSFAESPSDSIDYAVMEKTNLAVVVPLNAGWSDVGAWSAVWEIAKQDLQGNAARGDVVLKNTQNCYVHADHRLVSILGVEGIVVIETSDAVLIARKDKAQEVKGLVDDLKMKNRPEADFHREVCRPWGSYDSIGRGERYQVKRITLKPKAKLSLQLHHHRSEHWIVVKGSARVVLGSETKMLSENQSIYIPREEKHSLQNPSDTESLEIIEVQTGSYLGEDDIVRFEDIYGRI